MKKSLVCDKEVFLCQEDDPQSKFVTFDNLCDRKPSCGLENKVCQRAKNVQTTWDFLIEDQNAVKRVSYCFDGLKELQFLKGECVSANLFAPNKRILGVMTFPVLFPSEKQKCMNMFGELYVYLNCLGNCYKAECPLTQVPRKSCVNIPDEEMLYSLTADYSVTIVARKRDKYINKYFACENGNCITYDKVCNLANDCEDGSDETACANHFQCTETHEYIPLTSVCDKKIDCRDYSDECSESCPLSARNGGRHPSTAQST